MGSFTNSINGLLHEVVGHNRFNLKLGEKVHDIFRAAVELRMAALTAEALDFRNGEAVNAGGVATSGLEMTQNSQKLNWTAEEVDAKLHQIMSSIHHACVEYGTEKDGYLNYMKGANIAGFMKVAKSMVEQGVI